MMRFFLLFATLVMCASLLPATPIAFGNGEMFKFRVGWGIIWNAGEIRVEAHREQVDGKPTLRVSTTTTTRGVIRALYPFDGEAECIFDGNDGRMLEVKATTAAGKKKTNSSVVFDYETKKVRYIDHLNPNRTTTLPMPDGNPVDLITSLILTRNWDIKPGERNPAVVMFDDEFYELLIYAEGFDRVHTPWGDCKALVLEPKMETNPKGMFKRGGEVRVWISQDDRKLPVKFEVAMKFGTGTAYLTEYHPPEKPIAALADAAAHP